MLFLQPNQEEIPQYDGTADDKEHSEITAGTVNMFDILSCPGPFSGYVLKLIP